MTPITLDERYVIKEEIGEGSYSIVYRGEDLRWKMAVAVKENGKWGQALFHCRLKPVYGLGEKMPVPILRVLRAFVVRKIQFPTPYPYINILSRPTFTIPTAA